MNVLIVLNYNDCETVIDYLSRIYHYQSIDYIVVVDNDSTDGSYETLIQIIEQNYSQDRIHIVQTGNNKGYASGNNAGIRYCEKLYKADDVVYIISNPDVLYSETDLIAVLEPLNKGYDLSAGLVFNRNEHGERLASNFCWRVPSFSDLLSNCFLGLYKVKRTILRRSIYPNYNDVSSLRYIPAEAVPGCFFAITKPAMQSIEFFDEDTFLFMEETIIGYKLKRCGYKACVVNGTHISHLNSASIKKNIQSSVARERILLDSQLIYMKKYLRSTTTFCSFFKCCFWLGFIESRLWETVRSATHHC